VSDEAARGQVTNVLGRAHEVADLPQTYTRFIGYVPRAEIRDISRAIGTRGEEQMAARTVRDFQVGFDIGPIADAWAQSNHYGFRGMSPDGTRNYQRGNGILTGAMPLTIRQYGPAVHLEGWIHATLVARLCALFLIPTDMGIESGGVKGVLPRSMARGAVNKLLAQLGQPPIE
jgi:hypothetical protein